MTEHMPLSLRARLIEAAVASGRREICGFVLPDWCPVFIKNVAPGDGQFEMDELSMLNVFFDFPRPLGIFHSHPDGREEPSNMDWDYAPMNMRYWIITPTDVIEWDMSHDEPRRVEGPERILVNSDVEGGASHRRGDPAIAAEGSGSS